MLDQGSRIGRCGSSIPVGLMMHGNRLHLSAGKDKKKERLQLGIVVVENRWMERAVKHFSSVQAAERMSQ